MEVNGQPYALATSTGKQPPVLHQIAGWLGSRAKLEVVEKRKFLDPAWNSILHCPADSLTTVTMLSRH
jgi:hypothetical protein